MLPSPRLTWRFVMVVSSVAVLAGGLRVASSPRPAAPAADLDRELGQLLREVEALPSVPAPTPVLLAR